MTGNVIMKSGMVGMVWYGIPRHTYILGMASSGQAR